MGTPRVVVIGAGLAGLNCALQLLRLGVAVEVVEAADRPGGRVATDIVDGFKLDRGFQVLSPAYPELAKSFDVEQLDLQLFDSGAIIRTDGGSLERFIDPFRHPASLASAAFQRVLPLADKLRLARLRFQLARRDNAELLAERDMTTREYLRLRGFSAIAIDRFFRPFFGGVFLDTSLATSSRMFAFTFATFARARVGLPREGMQALAAAVSDQLPAGTLRLGARVATATAKSVTLESGESIAADHVVIATDQTEATTFAPDVQDFGWCATTNLYFAADKPPVRDKLLVLNAADGRIDHLCFPSSVAPSYAPGDRCLVSVTLIGDAPEDDVDLIGIVAAELVEWFGTTAQSWRHLRTYRVKRALPRQMPGKLLSAASEPRTRDGFFVCGDYRESASINGALLSGRKAAEAIAAELGITAAAAEALQAS